MCKKDIDNHPILLEFPSDCFITRTKNAVDDYLDPLKFVADCIETQKICEKALAQNISSILSNLKILKGSFLVNTKTQNI